MFDPEADLNVIQARLIGDAPLLDYLGLAGATNLTKAKHILKRNQWDDLAGTDKRLNLYFRSARMSVNEVISVQVLQVDCHVPMKEDVVAYRVQKRVKELLHRYEVNKRVLHFSGQLGELPSMPGFFCAGSRYIFYTTI